MNQLSKSKSILYHLYPGVFITLGFIFFAPAAIRNGYPPQFGMLIAILVIALPLMVGHLLHVKKSEGKSSLFEINGLTNRLPLTKLILYSIGLTVVAFVIWGLTQPLNVWLTEHLLNWLPSWYTVQDFAGYGKEKIQITLVANLLLNGLLAPCIEELYFRGYLLPRMEAWGKYAFVANAVLFSFYHFWQVYIYLTLIIALLPMTYMTWKTRDVRLAIVTHCLMNLVGALLSFGYLAQA
jgi:membrane protease YdiL (CAAX protease family)